MESEENVRSLHLKHALQELLAVLDESQMTEEQKERASYAYLALRQDEATFGHGNSKP